MTSAFRVVRRSRSGNGHSSYGWQMIVWINGPLGVGKTSLVRELVRLLPESRVHDPERLGWLLKRSVARLRPRDYQQLAVWRRGTILLAHWAGRGDRTVLIPMTVLDPECLDDLFNGP